MQKITPNIWFDGNAKEAVDFYVSIMPNAKLGEVSRYPNSAEEGLADFQQDLAGKELTVGFSIEGFEFNTINAGPDFKVNPAISFMLNFDTSRDSEAEAHLDELWAKLIDGGEALMALDSYPFSKRYGWVQDRYGVTWQLILTNPEGEPRPFVVPSMMFSGPNVNRATEAAQYYADVFEDGALGMTMPYGQQTGPADAGSLMFGEVQIGGQWFAVMDSGVEQDFTFNEAISLSIACKDQEEIDYFWGKLSKQPEGEQCGWCKDQFGVSWQVVPENIGELLQRPDAFSHMMEMKKLVIEGF